MVLPMRSGGSSSSCSTSTLMNRFVRIPYTKKMACAICNIRRPKRYCPGVRGEICTLCCGTEREETVSCPLDCSYLQQAHQIERDKTPPLEGNRISNPDIKVSDSFLEENETLLGQLGRSLMEAALETDGAIDYDVREALEALITTYRTLQSGVYYESRPTNPLAANLCRIIRTNLAEFEKEHKIRDAAVLGMLVFLQRIELNLNNGRKKGRAFIDFLQGFVAFKEPAASPLII